MPRKHYVKAKSKREKDVKNAIQKNVRTAIDRGMPPVRAVAMSYSMAGKSRKKPGPTRKWPKESYEPHHPPAKDSRFYETLKAAWDKTKKKHRKKRR